MSKNILFIHHVSCLAGAELYLLSVIEALDPSYKVFFICQEPGPLSQRLLERGVDVTYMPLRAWRKFKYFAANLRTVRDIVHWSREKKIDIICSNNYRVSSYAVWPARILGIPCLSIIQDFVSLAKLRKFNAFESDLLIGVSESITSMIGISKRPSVCVYNGLDMDAFMKDLPLEDVLRRQFPQLKDKRVVGMVAHIIPLKGHKDFLEAMRLVSVDCPDVMFVIIGDSPHEKQLSLDDIKVHAKHLGLEEKVVFTGARPDAPAFFKSFDVFVHPSHKEAFGRVVMEAMALRVPVVVTDCGGPREIIEKGVSGVLVPVGDAKKMAQAVVGLLKDEEARKALALNGQERIRKHFNIAATVGRFSAVLKGLLDGKKRGVK